MLGTVRHQQLLCLLLWACCSHSQRLNLILKGKLLFAYGKAGKMGHICKSHREATGKQKTEINSLKLGASTTITNLFYSVLFALLSGACFVKVLPMAGMRQCSGSLPAALAMIKLLVLVCMFIYTPRKLLLFTFAWSNCTFSIKLLNLGIPQETTLCPQFAQRLTQAGVF